MPFTSGATVAELEAGDAPSRAPSPGPGQRQGRRGWTAVRPALRQRTPSPVKAVPPARVDVAVDARLERLLDALAVAAEPIFRDVALALDLARYRNHVDIGGGNGLLSCIFAAHEPRLASHSCDLPEISAVAERRIRQRGLASRVRAEPLDPYSNEFPAADLVTLGHLLHDWNVQRRRMLIAKAWRALLPGGALVAIETIVDPAPRRAEVQVDTTGGVLVEYGDVLAFAGADFVRWSRDAGFRSCDVLELQGGGRAMVARK